MPPFDRLERMASRAVDRLNAVPATWTPMTSTPNARRRPDPNRSPMTIRGVFEQRPTSAGIEIGNRDTKNGNDFRLKRNAVSLEFSLDVGQLSGAIPPQQGDRLEISGIRYEVTSAQGDWHSRIVLKLIA